MSTFSSLTIHDFCIEREPITMHRAPSFPSLRYTSEPTIPIPSDQWPPPDPVSIIGRSLEIRLLDKVAEGRTGLIHSVQVLSEALDLPELCINVAKPRYCRSLAREAWFYSRLETLQGSVVPLCFGFFTAPIADCIPWNHISLKNTGAEVDDWLPDDVYDYCFDPEDGGREADSPWDKWKYDPDQEPLLVVLVMEKLGEPYYPNYRDPPHERHVRPSNESPRFPFSHNPGRDDLRNVVYDLGKAGFIHADMRFNNVLRAVNPGIFCVRHRCYHEWRLIDFDRSRYSLVFTAEAEEDQEFAESRIKEVGASHFRYGFP